MLFGSTLVSVLAVAGVAVAISPDEYHPAANALARRKLTKEQEQSLLSKSKSLSKSKALSSKSKSLARASLAASKSRSKAKSAEAKSKSASKSKSAASASKAAASASKSKSKTSSTKSASKTSSTKTSATASATAAAGACYRFSTLDFTMHDGFDSGSVAKCSKFCGANYPFVALLEATSPPAECFCVNAKTTKSLGTPVRASLCNGVFGAKSGNYVSVFPRKA